MVQLTLERATQAKLFNHITARIKSYCGQSSEVLSVTSIVSKTASIGRNLRSKVTKELFILTVPECKECDDRAIEAFPHEHEALLQKVPLQCNHKKEISGITALGIEAPEDFAPPITIPALQATTSRQAPRSSHSVISSVSTVTVPKLKKCKDDLEKRYRDLAASQAALETALQGLEEGELEGNDEVYS